MGIQFYAACLRDYRLICFDGSDWCVPCSPQAVACRGGNGVPLRQACYRFCLYGPLDVAFVGGRWRAWLSLRYQPCFLPTIIRGDASLASFYLIALALGIFMLSAAGSAVPLKSFLFGSILGLDNESLLLLGLVATVTLVSFSWLVRPLIMSTCDPAFFESQTGKPWITDQAFMVLLVLNLLGAFKTMGTLMAVGCLSFLLPPPVVGQ